MSVTSSLERCVISTTIFATTCLTIGPAFAAGSNMPWEQPLNQILQSVEGPVAKIIAVIIIIVTGLSLAFGDTSGGFRRLIQIVFGLSIAFAASSFFLSFCVSPVTSTREFSHDEPSGVSALEYASRGFSAVGGSC